MDKRNAIDAQSQDQRAESTAWWMRYVSSLVGAHVGVHQLMLTIRSIYFPPFLARLKTIFLPTFAAILEP